MKHTVKKLSSLFLALSLMAGLCLTPALAAEMNYADADASWAASSIERWSSSGIVKGDGNGSFNPSAPLSRAELAQIFVNMFGLTEKAENTFGDLKGTEWYADAILKCVAAGIMKGDGVNANAEANISRAETIVMFGRAVGVTPDEKPDLSKFSDGDSVAAWAAGYLAPLTKMGILSGGGDGTLNADGQIDRASTMALLDKSIAEYVSAPGEYKVDDANGFVIVNVAAKEGEVVISGAAAGIAVSAGTAEGKIVAKDLKADTIKVDGTAAVSVEGKSTVGEVVANATGEVSIAKGVTVDTVTANSTGTVANAGTVNSIVANGAATVSNTGTVKELVANAPATVDNKGTITKAEVKADGVVLDGKKPTTVTVDDKVENPTNSKGEEVKPGTDKPSYNPGPSYSTYPASDEATLKDAIVKASSGDVVSLTESFTVSETVVIDKAITLDGNGKTITVPVEYDGYAIQAYNAGNVTLKDIAAVGAKKGAILVNGSTVTLAGTVTVTGTWGGIEVGQGVGVANPGVLNIGSATLVHAGEAADKPTVWADSDSVGTVSGGSLTKVVVGGQSFYYLTAVSPESLTAMLANSSLATIKLGDDISGAGQIVISRPVTLDGNGKSITSSDNYAIHVYNVAGTVTLKDITANGAANNKGAILVNGSTVNLEGTITVTGFWGGIEVGKSDVGVANPGVLNIGSATLVHAGEAADKPTVWMDSADKGTVTGDNLFKFTQESGKVYYFLNADNSGAEASVDSVCYGTLKAAVDAADGKTVKLAKNVIIDEALIIDNAAITLDLNGKALKAALIETSGHAKGNVIVIAAAGTLTLQDSGEDGKITTDAIETAANYNTDPLVNCEGTFIMESGTIETAENVYYALGIFGSSCDATIQGGTIKSSWSNDTEGVAIGAEGTKTNEGYQLTINGGTIKGGEQAMYLPSAGTTTINGGTISGSKEGIEIRAGELTITGGTISATAARATNVSTNGGATGAYTGALVVAKSRLTSATGYNGHITVTMTGGTLVNENGDALCVVHEAHPGYGEAQNVAVSIDNEAVLSGGRNIQEGFGSIDGDSIALPNEEA